MARQRSGIQTAVIGIGVVIALCNAGALYMYAVQAQHWYKMPYFSYTARALSPVIGSTHRGEWGVHWGYGEWAMLAGGLVHLAGLALYHRSEGAERRLLWAINGTILISSLYYIIYFLIILPRTTLFVLPDTTPAQYWYPLFAEVGVRLFWIVSAGATLVLLGVGDEASAG